VWRATLDAAGFPTARIVELIETPQVKAQLLENTQRSVERGTFGAPTFYVDDEIFFGKDRLLEVEEMIMRSK
jgi:2-hydroxychromene-2-carboxylate isomerase